MVKMIWRAAALAGVLAAGVAAPAAAQRTTEQFIPVGQSPGVSGVSAYLGTITAVDSVRRRVTLGAAGGELTVQLSDTTRIWLDYSGQRRPAVAGTRADLAVGRTAEVKYLDPARKSGAEWIKVVMPAGP